MLVEFALPAFIARILQSLCVQYTTVRVDSLLWVHANQLRRSVVICGLKSEEWKDVEGDEIGEQFILCGVWGGMPAQ